MKRFFTLALLISTITLTAQHRMSITPDSDFKLIQNGIVKSTFVLDTELSASELADFTRWTQNNVALGEFNLVGKTLTTSLKFEANDRNVYDKMFIMMGVDILEIDVNGQRKVLDKDGFFVHFNL